MPLGKTSLPILRFLGAQEKNNLYLMAALGVIVAVYVAVNWTSTPVLQRMVSLFFVSGGSTSGRACLLLAPLQPAIGSSVPASQ